MTRAAEAYCLILDSAYRNTDVDVVIMVAVIGLSVEGVEKRSNIGKIMHMHAVVLLAMHSAFIASLTW